PSSAVAMLTRPATLAYASRRPRVQLYPMRVSLRAVRDLPATLLVGPAFHSPAPKASPYAATTIAATSWMRLTLVRRQGRALPLDAASRIHISFQLAGSTHKKHAAWQAAPRSFWLVSGAIPMMVVSAAGSSAGGQVGMGPHAV